MFRQVSSGFSCLYVVFFCLSSGQQLDDFVEIVKDFTALCILLDIDNNLMPKTIKSGLDMEDISDEDMTLMLKNHAKYIKSGAHKRVSTIVFDNLIFYFSELYRSASFVLIAFYMIP